MRKRDDTLSPPYPLGCREIHTFLLGAGALALGSAAIFFIAANWEALGRLGRFALLEGGLILSVLGALRFPPPSRAASALLLTASLLTGALLALTGQTYQLGADRWELFAWWAGLILPWVLAARSHLLWGLWALIFQTALWLYSVGSGSFISGGPELPLLADLVVLSLFEATAGRWSAERFDAPRLLIAAGGSATAVWTMLERHALSEAFLIALLWFLPLGWFYGILRRRLPLLAVGALGLLLSATVYLVRLLPWGHGWLLNLTLVTLAVFVMGAGLVRLLLHLNKGEETGMPVFRVDASAWAIYLFSAVAGWLGALMALLLFGTFFTLFLRMDLESTRFLAGATGVLLLLAVRARLPRAASTLHTHFWLAVSLSAQGLLLFALFGFFRHSEQTFFATAALLEALLFFAVPRGFHRAVSAFFFFAALLLWSRTLHLPQLYWIVTAAALTAALGSPLYRRFPGAAVTLAYGLIPAVLAGEFLSLAARMPGMAGGWSVHHPATPFAPLLPPLFALAGAAAGWILSRDERTKLPGPATAFLTGAVTALAAYHHPGAGLGILAAGLGTWRGERILGIFGLLIALAGMGLYYYALERTLLYKAAALAITAALLLGIDLLIRRFCDTGGDHA